MYLGPKLGLAGSKGHDAWRVNALALTALDGLSNEVHDTHHPMGVELQYEDEKAEGARCSMEWVKNRLTKHPGYLEKVLKDGKGQGTLEKDFTYADLVFFGQVPYTSSRIWNWSSVLTWHPY
jgi:glutathione S-transferase